MIRGAIFDFDGTLVQSNKLKREAFYTVTSHIEGAASALNDLFRSAPHLDRVGIFQALVQRLKVGDSQSLLDHYSELVRKEMESASEVPGARLFLTQLQVFRIHMAVCSATPAGFIGAVVKARCLEGFFSHVFGGVGAKSNGALKAIRDWGLSPADVAFFGDRESDRCAANNLGCKFVGILNEWSDFSESPRILEKDFYCLSKIIN